MTENELNENVELEQNDTEEEDVEQTEAQEQQEEQHKETPEAKKARLERQLKRINKQLGVEEPKAESKKETKPSDSKPGTLDYGQKAYLVANGIKGSTETALVEEFLAERPNRSLEDLLDSRAFQAELKELRETEATKKATPSGTRRATNTTRDSVDYWLAKGELPPADNAKLRRDVVNAKIAREKSGNRFSDNAVVTGAGIEIR